ncbi:heavy-metal-associated domain-containing protein [Jeotgalibaca caeni]|uniref:heavy-metal-associated domain-containing protein n=1 Tax=Jeotgalibaca caeni TaxID=3028623 RepID=UPI00237D8BC4|nr:heavy metal-associated domain-containing protein [Jeotgalibaca caeni]MDE1548557.1 heavy metal-associated domain-containing protein [Jeotgalibaca caeni]
MQQEVFVEGMKCQGCVNTVKTRFESIEGVESVSVDQESKKVTVNSQSVVDKTAFMAVLEDTKYSVVG